MSLASRKLIQATAGAAGAGEAVDDDFANVVLLLDGDGTSGDANNTFTDSSTNGFTVTETGSVVQGSFSPYGDNWSNYFDGVDDAVYTASSTGLVFGTGDFTIECWAYRSADPNPYSRIFNFGSFNDSNSVGINFDDGDYPNKLTFFSNTLGGRLLVSTTSVASGEWYHIAVTRESGTFKLWLNGSLEDTDTTSGSVEGVSTQLVAIGSAYNRYVQEPFNGYISNARIVKGTAVYTSAFTPPTTPLTAISGTQLLLSGSNRFVDESSNNLSLTLNSAPKVTPFSPFKDSNARILTTDGGSGYFGGSGNYLTVPDNADFDFGTGDITVEFWFNTSQVSGRQDPFSFYGGVSGGLGIGLNHDQNQDVLVYVGNTTLINTSGSQWSVNAWNHLALSRSGTTLKLFINGSEISSITNSSNLNAPVDLHIGVAGNLTQPYTGYISNVRVIKGTGLYTSAFTPPTAPLTAITNTETLLSFQDSGIYDRSGINNLDTVGNAQIDTAVKKYGSGSIEFSGNTTDKLVVSSPELVLGTGDFTIEFWVYFNSINDGNVYTLLDGRTSSDTTALVIAQESSGAWTSRLGDSTLVNEGWNSATFTTGTWYHIAITRESGTTRYFKDGTKTSADLSDTGNYDSDTYNIGGRYATSGNSINGFIDDFRITKGLARYTTNFTPPTAALPKF